MTPGHAIAPWLWCAAAAASAAPVTYELDPQASFVHFEVLHFGTSTVRGRFGPVAGEVTLDREARSGVVGVRIRTGGVSTGVRVFDSRLREDDMLASAEHPEAFFVARGFRFEGSGAATTLAEVRGEFTLRGIGQPLSLFARRFGCRLDAASSREVCGGDFEGEIRRSDFGLTFGLPFIADRVLLRVQVEGMRR